MQAHEVGSVEPSDTPRWRLWVRAVSVLLVPLLIAVIVLWIARPPASSVGIQTCVLPDGSRLVLHAATFGKHHRFETEQRDRFLRLKPLKLTENTPWPSAVLWFTYDGKSSRPNPAEGWSWGMVTDDLGQEHRFEFRHPSQERRFFVLKAGLRAIRLSAATFELELFNKSGQRIAVFEVPNPFPAAPPLIEWKPESLPITKEVADDLALTLEGFQTRSIPGTTPGSTVLAIQSQTTVLHKGEPTEGWEVYDWSFSDPFGIVARPNECTLSPREPVWKFYCEVRRPRRAMLPSDVIVEVGTFSIPAVNDEATIELTQDYEINLRCFRPHQGSTSAPPKQDKDLFVGLKSRRLTPASPRPASMSAAETSYVTSDIEVRDDRGEWLEEILRPSPGPGGQNARAFGVPKESKSIRIRKVINHHYFVEFFVTPPKPPEDSTIAP